MLELRGHKDRASTALAAAQQQILHLTSALMEARDLPDKSQMASTLEVRLSACKLLPQLHCLKGFASAVLPERFCDRWRQRAGSG